MKMIKAKKFSDGSIGEYYLTGDYADGFPSVYFFWKGAECPTRLELDRNNYVYTHGGKIYQEACREFPSGYSQG